MNLEMKDELELTATKRNSEKENEISEIIKLFQFSNLSLIISNAKGGIVFASNAFCNLSGFSVKELVRENLDSAKFYIFPCKLNYLFIQYWNKTKKQ